MSCDNQTQARLLQSINEVSFAVDDILLYLDTHPCDQKALSYYQEAVTRRNSLMAQYAENYGPLTIDDAVLSGTDTWKWMEQPFPWVREGV